MVTEFQSKRSRHRPSWTVGVVLVVATVWIFWPGRALPEVAGTATTANATASTLESLILAQIPADRTLPDGQARFDSLSPPPAGSRIVFADLAEPRQPPIHLTSGFDAAGVPCLSYDAQQILFVGHRDASEPMGVWEMNVDGTEARKVYTPPGGCDRAIYLSTLYTIDAPEPVERIAFRAIGYGGKPQFFSCGPRGEDVQQITYAPGGVSDPYLLSEGRLLFAMRGGAMGESSSEEAGDGWFTINTDGTDVFPFAAVDEPPATRSTPCETADGRVIYVEQSLGGGDTSALISVSLARSLHTRQMITSASRGTYHAPSSAAGQTTIVSYRTGSATTFGVFGIGTGGGAVDAKLFDDPAWHDVDAQFVQPRTKPSGRSSVVRNTMQIGRLYCLDAYISSTRQGAGIADGQIDRFRIMTPDALATDPADTNGPRGDNESSGDVLLGGGKIDADGSFSVELPARMPFRIETVDRAGRILQSMGTWIWVMPMERRGCIGCHEDRELTPPNRHVIALRKRPQQIGLHRINAAGEATTIYQQPGDGE